MIYFTGDINLSDNYFDIGYGVGSQIAQGLNPFHSFIKKEGDIWIGNFEGVTSYSSCKEGCHKQSFRINPALIKAASFIDYWGLANNHAMEHGATAYKEMEQALCNISKGVFGTKDKHSIQFVSDLKTIVVTGFSYRDDKLSTEGLYWSFPTFDEISKELQQTKGADIKIAYVHWGVEFIDYPNWEQQMLAHWLIDNGYDLIIGMHPHLLQGYEIYKGKYIFYSLGNFIFNQGWECTKYGGVVGLNTKNKEVTFNYIKINQDYSPSIISEEFVPKSIRMATLNKKIGKFENPEDYILNANIGLKKHRHYNHLSIVRNLYRANKKALLSIVTDYFKRHL